MNRGLCRRNLRRGNKNSVLHNVNRVSCDKPDMPVNSRARIPARRRLRRGVRAHGDDVVTRVQGAADIERWRDRPVGGNANALAVYENPAVVVNPAEPDLHARAGEVRRRQFDVGAVDGRLAFAQNLVAAGRRG